MASSRNVLVYCDTRLRSIVTGWMDVVHDGQLPVSQHGAEIFYTGPDVNRSAMLKPSKTNRKLRTKYLIFSILTQVYRFFFPAGFAKFRSLGLRLRAKNILLRPGKYRLLTWRDAFFLPSPKNGL